MRPLFYSFLTFYFMYAFSAHAQAKEHTKSLVGVTAELPLDEAKKSSELQPTLHHDAGGELKSDFSGLAKIESGAYLAVHDGKASENEKNIFSLIEIKEPSTFNQKPVSVKKAAKEILTDTVSDLEAICKAKETKNEFYAFESQRYKGKGGRIFKLALNDEKSTIDILDARYLPKEFDNSTSNWNLEGVLCLEGNHFILSDRNGNALLKTSWDSNDFYLKTEKIYKMSGVFAKALSGYNRKIADLAYHHGTIIASANNDTDGSEVGPYSSVLYVLDTLKNLESGKTIKSYIKVSDMPSNKVEALLFTEDKSNRMLIGSDDEAMGGGVRLVQFQGIADALEAAIGTSNR